jgi:hypothetical protein
MSPRIRMDRRDRRPFPFFFGLAVAFGLRFGFVFGFIFRLAFAPIILPPSHKLQRCLVLLWFGRLLLWFTRWRWFGGLLVRFLSFRWRGLLWLWLRFSLRLFHYLNMQAPHFFLQIIEFTGSR